MSNKHDIHYGRRSGRIVGYTDTLDINRAPLCDECAMPMVVGQRGRHFLCDPTSIVGRACTCPPDCTRDLIGDQGKCDVECHPCRIGRGQPATKPGRTKP